MRLRFKHFLRERDEFSARGDETLLSVSEYYGVKPRSEAFVGEEYVSRAESLEGYRIVRRGDFVMNYMLAWKGAYGLSEQDGIVSPAYAVFEVNDRIVDRRYLHHRSRSNDMKAAFRSWSKGIIESRLRLYPDSLLAMEIELPDLPTQKRIAAFLDREMGRIDELIGKKERLVEVLKARFDVMVQDSVTNGHGLPGINLQPSGVDYLGRVPEHWSVEKVGWRYSVQLGKMLDAAKQTGQHERPYLRVADVQWDAINSDDLPVMDFSRDDQQKFQIRPGDLLVNEGGSYVGRSAIWRGAADVVFYQKALHRLRPHNSRRDSTEYMLWIMWFATREGIFVANGNQTTIDHLTAEAFKAYRFPFPPLAEQEIIADQLRRERDRSKALETQIQLSIDRLREYRAALITATVTGQIDVDTYSKAGKTSATLERIEEEMQA